MGLFDWVPTVEEVFDFIDCRLAGHTWRNYVRPDSSVVRVCAVCGKQEET